MIMIIDEPEEKQTLELIATEPEDLKPKKITNKAPEGVRTFTVCRQSDESGVSGEGVVIEGCMFATGHTVIHWLTPAPLGSLAIFNSFNDFISIHIKPHPKNNTIITWDDGEQTIYEERG
tara:strand:- start:360 stop:719 length:360 start_codon:yes stop_codon:yes gene_type:complete